MRADELVALLRPQLEKWDATLEVVHKGQHIVWVSKRTGPDIGIIFGREGDPDALVTVNEFGFDEVALDDVPEFVASVFEGRAQIRIRGRLLKWITLAVPLHDKALESAHRFTGPLDPWQVELKV